MGRGVETAKEATEKNRERKKEKRPARNTWREERMGEREKGRKGKIKHSLLQQARHTWLLLGNCWAEP